MVELADAVARKMQLDEASRQALDWAARLHDIGKIGVPDRILHKPGKLDADERLVLQRHVVWGAEAVARVPGWSRVADIIGAHHERWDGRGYPGGLCGEAIPVESRIVGLCEAFRSLTSERPYRPGIEPGRALAIVISAAGSHFDPATVRALSAALAAEGITAAETGVDRRQSALGPPRTREGPSEFGRRLPGALARMERLPALVESRDRLIGLLRSERPADGEIVRAVESDIALVVGVLRMANSGAGKRRTIASVPEAVRAVSPEGVEMLASRIAVVDLLRARSSGPVAQRLRVHALAVQRAADRVAAALAVHERDELLVAALLHDIGTLVLDDAFDGYPQALHKTARTPEERARAERHELGIDHAALGGVLLRRWGFPDRLAEAVEQHHAPRPAGAAAIVQLADQLAHYNQGQPVDPAQVLRTAQDLGLRADALRQVMYDLAVGGKDTPRRLEACPLTSHELAVVRGLAEGMLYKDIAADLGVATSTVRSHLHKAYRRLGVTDRAQAVLICARKGWL
jgi:putative nucleotidyltransferase with HDIG domain